MILGDTISRVLNVLDTLDRHNFDKVENGVSIDSLYQKIFSTEKTKEQNSEVRPVSFTFIYASYWFKKILSTIKISIVKRNKQKGEAESKMVGM